MDIKKVWYFMMSDKDEPEEEMIYAVATSKEDKERFIRERGCKNMRIVKEIDTDAIIEILSDPREYNVLAEYKVGINRKGEELTLLMTGNEHIEAMHHMAAMRGTIEHDLNLSERIFKKEYRNALKFVKKYPLSLLTITIDLFRDSFT